MKTSSTGLADVSRRGFSNETDGARSSMTSIVYFGDPATCSPRAPSSSTWY
jgi:hypothetical protein